MPNPWDDISTNVTNVLRKFPEYIPRQDMTRERLDNLDLARGFAITLMMLSHTVMSLNAYSSVPAWGMVPVHLITKFSSSLFIITFGISISLFYVSVYDEPEWSGRRNRLLWRAFNILLWYKILTVVQMFQTYPKETVIDTLLFKNFTDFTEVLNFYWLAIFWIVLLIPFWARINVAIKIMLIGILAMSGTLLNAYADFGGIWQIKAMLVEYKGAFCYGQFQRGALALFGMLLGELLIDEDKRDRNRLILASILLGLAALMAGLFLFVTRESAEVRSNVLAAISRNYGKHPPNLEFLSFSLAGAFSLLSFAMFTPRFALGLFKPFMLIGKEPFFCFNFHIIMIFILYRYILDLRGNVSYPETLVLFVCVFLSSALLSPVNSLIKKQGVLFKWLLP